MGWRDTLRLHPQELGVFTWWDFRKRKHTIIPPGKNARFLRMQSQRVAQTDSAELLKSGALTVRAHDRAAPKLWIVNIDIRRRDIEIAADDQIDIFLFDQAIAQSHVPFQFIFVGWRANGLAVRRVNRVDA